jgi:hypothetical protein
MTSTTATNLVIPLFIEKAREGTYFTVPFRMPPDIENLTLSYSYEHQRENNEAVSAGKFVSKEKNNWVDLGLIAPDGTQVGASGSVRPEIFISATAATPGYKPHELTAGEWQILVGAYKIAPEGVKVTYELKMTPKRLRLFKGDLHMHTLASDGVQTAEELGLRALRHGLDFLTITDHNQSISTDSLPKIDGVTIFPGLEWTLYKGHANFLGSEQPYEGSFIANTPAEILAHFESARRSGATIVINHPYDEDYPFTFDLDTLPYDLIEVWNGPMREANLKAVGLWHSMLMVGKKVPVCGGSDFHRDTPLLFLGGPTTCVYAKSQSPVDILTALRQGHAFITFEPNGPLLQMSAGEAFLGDSLAWSERKELFISLDGLLKGDVVRLVTNETATVILQAPADGHFELSYSLSAPGFARVELLRAFMPGLPLLPVLLSNPMYFDAK